MVCYCVMNAGLSLQLRAKLGLLTKAPFAAAIAFIPTKKRRRRASSDTLNHPFEVHGGSGKKAVVFRCRYSSSCETCQIVTSLLDCEGTLAPDLPQAQSISVLRRSTPQALCVLGCLKVVNHEAASLIPLPGTDAALIFRTLTAFCSLCPIHPVQAMSVSLQRPERKNFAHGAGVRICIRIV